MGTPTRATKSVKGMIGGDDVGGFVIGCAVAGEEGWGGRLRDGLLITRKLRIEGSGCAGEGEEGLGGWLRMGLLMTRKLRIGGSGSVDDLESRQPMFDCWGWWVG